MLNAGSWGFSTGFENEDGTAVARLIPCNANCNGDDLLLAEGTVYAAQRDGGTELIANAASPPFAAYAGVPFPVDVTLSSLHRNGLGPFTYSLHLVAPGQTQLGAPIFRSGPITLNPYELRTFTATPAVDVMTLEGRYRIGLSVDEGDAIAEPDETNNELISQDDFLLRAPRADFTALDVLPQSDSAMPGQTVALRLELRNAGSLAREASYRVVLSTNDVVSADDLTVLEDIATLEAFSNVALSVQLPLPSELSVGDYRVGVVLDPEDDVPEVSEVNNTGISQDSLQVRADALNIATNRLPGGYVNVPYSHFLQARGGEGDYTWSLQSGELPQGLSLMSSGELRGTPTEAASVSLVLQVDSGGASDSASVQLSVEVPSGDLTIVPQALLPGIVGDRYPPSPPGTPQAQQQRILAVGARGELSFALRSTPPPGLSLDPDGYLHGSPLQKGVFEMEIEASDGQRTVSRTIPLTVGEPGRLTLVARRLPTGAIGAPYEAHLETFGQLETATVTFSTSDPLPEGLSLTERGVLLGIPQKVETTRFAVVVTESTGPDALSDSAVFEIEIEQERGLEFTADTWPMAIVGEAYRATLSARQGEPPLIWEVLGALPLGIDFETIVQGDQEVLRLDGVPERAELSAFTVRVIDARGRLVEQPMSLWVTEPEASAPESTGCACVSYGRRGGTALVLISVIGLIMIPIRLSPNRARESARKEKI